MNQNDIIFILLTFVFFTFISTLFARSALAFKRELNHKSSEQNAGASRGNREPKEVERINETSKKNCRWEEKRHKDDSWIELHVFSGLQGRIYYGNIYDIDKNTQSCEKHCTS